VGEPGAGLTGRRPHRRLGERRLGLRALGVLDRVDQGDSVAARRRNGPELVERGNRRAADLGEAVVEFLLAHTELFRDLLVGRRPAELRLVAPDRTLDVPGPRAP